MSSSTPFVMTPEVEVITFKQGSGESFKDAWARILESYGKTEPRITMSMLLSSFYFGFILCYRYALDAIAGGYFLRHNGDQAFNAIKSLVASSSSTSNKEESTLENIASRLENLELNMTSMGSIENMVKELHEGSLYKVPKFIYGDNKPVDWIPSIKIEINDIKFRAICDIATQFSLMPESIYDSLNLWELSNSTIHVMFADNSINIPLGLAYGVKTKLFGSFIPIDFHVIKCEAEGHITLGRSFLKLVGAVIDID